MKGKGNRRGIESEYSLTKIGLDGNEIGDVGEALKENSLTRVDLDKNYW